MEHHQVDGNEPTQENEDAPKVIKGNLLWNYSRRHRSSNHTEIAEHPYTAKFRQFSLELEQDCVRFHQRKRLLFRLRLAIGLGCCAIAGLAWLGSR